MSPPEASIQNTFFQDSALNDTTVNFAPNELSFAPTDSLIVNHKALDTKPDQIKIKAKAPAPKGGKLDFPYRSDKLIKLIDAKLGPSSSEVHRYDITLLEKQALRFLKLEDDQKLML